MFRNGNRHRDLPSWKILDEFLKCSDNGRPQHLQVADENDDLWITGVIAMYRVVTMGLSGKVIGPPKTLQQLVGLVSKTFKNSTCLRSRRSC